jgi:hypothetical protein
MAIVPAGLVRSEEVSSRVHQLQMRYADNPLVKGIDYRIGFDWSDDPAVFIDVMLAGKDIASSELQQLAENIRVDLLRVVRTDEIGLHSYLSFLS